jgi:propanediol dehydratase small subunit
MWYNIGTVEIAFTGGEMGNISIEEKINAELKGIPKDKLPEIYDLIHYYRKGVTEERAEDIRGLRLASENKFAEVWKRENDDVWESYL